MTEQTTVEPGDLTSIDPDELQYTATVLVKFTVSRIDDIPHRNVFRKIEREGDQKMDQIHRLQALKLGLGAKYTQVGRFRKGRVDTGVEILKNPKLPEGGSLIQALIASNRFNLMDMFYYARQPDKTKEIRFTMGLKFSAVSQDEPLYVADPGIAAVIEELSRMTWQYLTVWANPDLSQIVNFGGQMRGQKAKHAIVIANDKIVAVPIASEAPDAQ